jgi:hypothetical protein
MLTIVSVLVYTFTPRQVLLYRHRHDQQVPGNKGITAMPTAVVVRAVFSAVAVVRLYLETHEVSRTYGVHSHHLLNRDALGFDQPWYTVPPGPNHDQQVRSP